MLAVLASRAFALDGPLVELSAEPATVEIGHEITATLVYRWPAGWTAVEPRPADDLRDEFVTELPPPEATRTGEEERRRYRVRLLARRSGAWALPRPQLIARGPQGDATATAPAVIVQVGTAAAPAALAAPRPLRARPHHQLGPSRWWWSLIALPLVVALIAAWWWRRRRRTPPPTAAEVFAAACRGLDALPDGKEAGARLSLAVRRYAGAQWRFDGAGATTRECLARLRATLPSEEHHQLAKLLDGLDDLRWSAETLDSVAVHPLAEQARAWVAAVEARLTEERMAAAAAANRPADPRAPLEARAP